MHRLVRIHEKNETAATDEFLMGGRKMPVLPIALSLLTTFLSGIVLLGTPAEIYQKGMSCMLEQALSKRCKLVNYRFI